MGTVTLLFSALSLIVSGGSILLVLVLTGRRDRAYSDQRETVGQVTMKLELNDRVDHLAEGLSRTWRYVEAVDDTNGGRGHQLLIERLQAISAGSKQYQ
jgi:hypothetical protein